MRSIIDSSGRDCVLIILFRLYGSKAGLFGVNLFWVRQYDPHPSYWKKTNPILIYLMQFLSNLSKIFLSQKAADIIL